MTGDARREARLDRCVAAVAAIVTLGIYAATLGPVVYVGDSGELVACADRLAVAHPTGYPLYLIAGKLFSTVVPFGSVAWRMNLFSAVSGAGAAAAIVFLMLRVGAPRMAALATSLVYALGPSFWLQSVVARVYTLSVLLIVLALIALHRFVTTGSRRDHALFFLLFGLSLSVHTFSIGLLPLWLYLFVARRGWRTVGVVGLGLSFWLFVLGLSFYLYLPLRAQVNVPSKLGHWGDLHRPDELIDYLTRADLWSRAWVDSAATAASAVLDWATSIPGELVFVFPFLALLALRKIASDRFLHGLLLVALVSAALVILHGNRFDIFITHRYYLPTYLVFSVLGGVGLAHLQRRIPLRGPAAVLVLALPLASVLVHGSRVDRSEHRIGDAFNRALLGSLPEESVLVADQDNVFFNLVVLRRVEGVRPDVSLYHVSHPELPAILVRETRRPVFFTHRSHDPPPGKILVSEGLVYRMIDHDAPWRFTDAFADPPFAGVDRHVRYGDMHTTALLVHYFALQADHYEYVDRERADEAVERMCVAGAIHPYAHNVAANYYERHGRYDEARAKYEDTRRVEGKPRPEIARALVTLAALERVEALRDRIAAEDPVPRPREAFERGRRLLEAGRRQEALPDLFRARRALPADLGITRTLARALFELELLVPARELLRDAFERHPRDRDLRETLRSLERLLRFPDSHPGYGA